MNHASLSLPISLACSKTITNTHHCQLAGPKVNEVTTWCTWAGASTSTNQRLTESQNDEGSVGASTPRRHEPQGTFFLVSQLGTEQLSASCQGEMGVSSISESLAWRLLGGCLARILAPRVQWKAVSAGCTTADGPHRRPGVVSGMESEDPALRRTSLSPAARLVAGPGRHALAALGGILSGPTT